jgi:putative MATE family efflux protein
MLFAKDSISSPLPLRELTREVLALAGPAVLTTFLQTLVFLTDRVLLGRYSEAALASMQVQGPLLWSLFGVFSGLVVGTVPLVARAVGGADPARARAVTRAALALAFGLGALVVVVCWPASGAIVRLLGPDSASLRALSERYISIALFGFPQMFVATAAAMVLHGAGNTKTPLAVGLVSNGVNIVLSLALIFGVELGPVRIPELGVAGAALGSVAAFSLEALLLLVALARGRAGFSVNLFCFRAPERIALRALARVSSPALAERIVMHGGFVAYAAIINALGPLVMASNQALITLEAICFLSADGFGVAAASLVGRSLGAGSPRLSRAAGELATGLCMAALTLFGLLVWVSGPVTLRSFVPSGSEGTALIESAMSAMPVLALSQPFMAAAIVLGHALRGAGDTRSPLVAALAGGVVVRLSLAAWLGLGLELGLSSVWIASAVDWVCRALLLGGMFARGRWAQIRL